MWCVMWWRYNGIRNDGTVLSTARSVFAVPSRHWATLSLLSRLCYFLRSDIVVSPCPRYRDDDPHINYKDRTGNEEWHLNWIGIDSPSASWGAFAQIDKPLNKRSFVIAFQSETSVWEFGSAIVEVRLVSRGGSSRNPRTLDGGGLADWKGVGGLR